MSIFRSGGLIEAIVGAMKKAFTTMIEADRALQQNPEDSAAREALTSAEKRARMTSDILRAMAHEPSGKRSLPHGPDQKEAAANRQIACRGILMAQGIFPLAHLLTAHLERIKFNCLITIHNVLLSVKGADKEEAKKHFFAANGVQILAELLGYDNPKFLAILCDCLCLVATRDRKIKELILQQKGTEKLVQILQKFNYPNLIERALKLFQGLAACPANKKMINDHCGMELLASFLKPENKAHKDMIGYFAASSMRNLSDSANKIGNPSKLATIMLASLSKNHKVCN